MPNFFKNFILLHQFKRLAKRVKHLVDSPDEIGKIVGNAERDVLEDQINTVLSRTPADILKKYRTGARIQPISNLSIKALSKMSVNQLASIKGVGPKSAESIKACTNAFVKDVRDNARIHISADSRTDNESRLVRALYQVDKLEELSSETQYQTEGLFSDARLHYARVAAHPLLWVFSNDRDRAISSIDEIQALLESPLVTEISGLEKKKSEILRVQHDIYWSAFCRDPAKYYSILDAQNTAGKGQRRSGRRDSYLDVFDYNLRREIEQVVVKTKGLKCTLRPYQLVGVKYILNQGNVLLGDEMGLGKTIQAIAAMLSLRNSGYTHFVVVCPASVLINWQREIKRHSDLKCFVLHGKDYSQKLEQWEEHGGVAVTNFENTAKFISEKPITMTVVDEAHYIKNKNALRTRNTVRILGRSDRRLFMSGTPLENKLDEMVMLISLLQPEIVSRIYDLKQPINAQMFREVVAPVYFRRTKDAVWREMPDLQIVEEVVELTPAEKKLYIDCLRERSDGAFTKMRQISFEVPDADSSKLHRIEEICSEAMDNNKKIIIFSFYLDTIKKIQGYLKNSVYGPITGSISPHKRQAVIDDFSAHNGGAVLLSQIFAGGTGLNIQAATIVILCEPQYKPSIENQAIARAYRMGQNSKVTVYRLIGEKTVDERILQVLYEKQALFDAYANKSISGENSLAVKESDIARDEFMNSQVA